MKKSRIVAFAGGIVAAAAVALAVTLPLGGGVTTATVSNDGLDGCNNTALTNLVVAYDNDGNEVAASSLGSGSYDGYTFSLTQDAPAELTSADILDEFKDTITYYESSKLFKATSLQAIDAFVDEQYITSIEPDYVMTVADVDEEELSEAVDEASENAAAEYQTKENTSTPNDPKYTAGSQWNLAQMNVEGAWEAGLYGQNYDEADTTPVKVAVVDSGLVGTGNGQSKHEDLDYSHVLEGVNLYDSTDGTPDYLGHGTFCTGLIAAQANNSKGIAGIAPEVDIYPIRVFGSGRTTSDSLIVEGVYKAIDADADVINLSLGGTSGSNALKTACEKAVNAGIIVVAAAGNESTETNSYPAAFDCVIGVSSTDQAVDGAEPALSYYSNYGEDNVFVAAPGAKVTSLSNTFSSSGASQYSTASGTSFSCPEVVALGAVSKSVFPDYNQSDFMSLLKETSQDMGTTGYDKYYGWGIVDFGAVAKSLLEKAYVPTYYLSLNTVDQDGKGLDGAEVVLQAAEDISWEDDASAGITKGAWPSGTTISRDGDGTYHLHRGTYKYTVTKDGYQTATGTFTTYKAQQTETATLEKTYKLKLNILDEEGDELDGASIALSRVTGSALEYSCTQGEDGLYCLNVASGTYKYDVTVYGYESAAGYLMVNAKDTAQDITMYLSDQVSYVSFDCRSGSEQGDAIANATVKLEDSNGNDVVALADGRYLLERGAKYYYTVTRPGYQSQTGKFAVEDAANQTVTVVLLPVAHSVVISAVDAQGNALDAEIAITNSAGSAVSPTKTDDTLYSLEPGTYNFTLNCSGYGVKTGSFTVESSDDYREIEIVMNAATAKVELSARDAGGNEISGANLTVLSADGDYQPQASGAKDAWNLATGTYVLIAQAEGYKVACSNIDVVAGTPLEDYITLTAGSSEEESGFSGGTGTESDPYLVSTEAQLRSIASDSSLLSKSYILVNDIALANGNWTPIGTYESENSNAPFTGVFEGAGHTVSGMNVNVTSGYAGFFGIVKGAQISDLTVKGKVNTTGGKAAGGLTGGIINDVSGDNANPTVIMNCEFNGSVYGTTKVGGLVGLANSANEEADRANIYINGCAHTGTVNDTVRAGTSMAALGDYAGGIVGVANAVNISSCYNTVTVIGGSYVGGITGKTGENAGTTACYNTGVVNKTGDYRGGITGYLSGTISNCFWLDGTGPNSNAGHSTDSAVDKTAGKKSSAELKAASIVSVLNTNESLIEDTYVAVSNGYPKFIWQVGTTPESSAETPVYSLQPSGAAYTVGASDVASLVACVDKVSDGGTLSYQWYRNDMMSTREADAIEGANGTLSDENGYSTSYTPSVDEVGTSYYYVVVTNSSTDSLGVVRRSAAKSEIVQVAVTEPDIATEPTVTSVGVVDDQGASTEQATYDQGEATGNKVAVEASADDGGTLSYQWYKSMYPTTKGTAIEGATSAACPIDTETAGKYYYYCKVSNSLNGSRCTVNSDRVLITINAAEPTPVPGADLTIASAKDLESFAAAVNAGDDFAGKTVALAYDISLANSGEWTPIGTESAPFAGTFKGMGHTISGLSITKDNNGNVGLFGCSTGTVTALNVNGNVGPVTGSSDTSTALDNVGGVAGYNGGTVSDCTSTVTVEVRSGHIYAVGGVVGQNGPGATIERCVNNGSVTGAKSVGGVCGRNFGTIDQSLNTADVTGNSVAIGASKHKDGVGGVCGMAGNKKGEYANKITACYNTGSVSNPGGQWYGGICGFADNATTLKGCYDTGAIAAGDSDDWEWNPIIGSVDDAYATVTNNYSLQGLNAGSTTDAEYKSTTVGTVVSADEFKALAAKLNNTKAAYVDGSQGLPLLAWQTGEDPVTPELAGAKQEANKTLDKLAEDIDGLTNEQKTEVKAIIEEYAAMVAEAATQEEIDSLLAKANDAVAQVVNRDTRTSLAGATVTLSAGNLVYTGKKLEPSVTVSLNGATLGYGSDYTVSYSNNTNVGQATVTVTGAGSYKDAVTKTFTINPKAATLKSLKALKKGFKAKWTKQAKQSTGYQLRYSVKKNMKGAASVKVNGGTTASKQVKKLKAKKKYYVQVRVYKIVDGKTYYGSWSAKKAVKTK